MTKKTAPAAFIRRLAWSSSLATILLAAVTYLVISSARPAGAADPTSDEGLRKEISVLKEEIKSLTATSAQLTERVAKLESENSSMSKSLAELIAAGAKVVMETGGGKTPSPPSESDAEKALSRIVEQESQGRITLLRFTKINGQHTSMFGISSYIMDYKADIEIVEACYWGGVGLLPWDGRFETEPGNMPAMAAVRKQRGSRGQKFTVSGKLSFEHSERGWKGRDGTLVSRGAGTQSKGETLSPAQASSANLSGTTEPAPPKRSALLEEVRIVNDTFGTLSVYLDNETTPEEVKGQRTMFRKLEVGTVHRLKAVGARGKYDRGFTVQAGMRAIHIASSDLR